MSQEKLRQEDFVPDYWAPRCTLCDRVGDEVEEVLLGEEAYGICPSCKGGKREDILIQRTIFEQKVNMFGDWCKEHGCLMELCPEFGNFGCVALTVDDVYPWPSEAMDDETH